ncbi:hypothetical protein GCM10027055_02410 [Janibacter alkaliphilus]|uniref:Uncharacterized protein n=1 Tax=Janibacter alkaliphilus TaxID=1069963 RepID=A0A852XED5_9MICO|nr:hypothetical protein [Janibacter alkaliphilus]NYG36855.1 hypothetical protein [Janibacter alkaliphilus]
MSMDQEMVAVLEREVEGRLAKVGPARDVDELVAGGRARRRRRRALGGVAGAAAVAMVAGGVALATTLAPEPPAPPATTQAAPFAGCTLEPRTCDVQVVDTWLDGLGAETGTPGWERVTDEWMTGLAPGGYGYAVPVHDDEGMQIASADGLVAPEIDVQGYLDEISSGVAPGDVDVRAVAVPTDAGEVSAVVVTLDDDGRWFQVWLVDEGDGHGAVLVTYEGTYPEGATPSFGLSGGSDAPTGWTDERVGALVAELLTEPPA